MDSFLLSDSPVVRIEKNSTTKKEILQIVLQWMREQGYNASVQVLLEEAGAQHRGEHFVRKSISSMLRSVEEHNWEGASKALRRLQQLVCPEEGNQHCNVQLAYLTKVLPFLLVQQQFLETIGTDDDGVRAFMFFQKNVKPFEMFVDKHNFQKLAYLLTCKNVRDASTVFPEYATWTAALGCCQLMEFIQNALSSTFLNSTGIVSSPDKLYSTDLLKPLEAHLEEAVSYRVLAYRASSVARSLVKPIVIESLGCPLNKHLASIEPLRSFNIASLRGSGRCALTSCAPILSRDAIAFGLSTGEITLLSTTLFSKLDGSLKDSQLALLYKLRDSVQGISVKNDKLLCWGGRHAVLLDVSLFSQQASTDQGYVLHTLHFEEDVYCSCFLRDTETAIATGHADGSVAVWDAAKSERIYQISVSSSPLIGLIINALGTIFYTASQDGIIRAIDTSTGIILLQLVPPIPMEVSAIALSPSSLRLLAAYRCGTLRLWDTVSGAELPIRFSNTKNTKRKASICFGNVDSHIFCGTDTGAVMFWDTSAFPKDTKPSTLLAGTVREASKEICLHRGCVNDLTVCNDLLLSCSDDGCLFVCSNRLPP